MSGIGGGKPGNVRAFWDADTCLPVDIHDGSTSVVDVVEELRSHIEKLEKRIQELETAYMEEKLLGSDPGKIKT